MAKCSPPEFGMACSHSPIFAEQSPSLYSLLGVISTADILDRETAGSYWLTVYATDRGVVPLYSSIEVYIEIEDVNDNAPLTSDPIYYPVIMENSPKDVSVIQIQAEDPDSSSNEKLTYRITSGNPQNFFTINTKTGKGMLIMTSKTGTTVFKSIGLTLVYIILCIPCFLPYCVENSILLFGHSF